MVHTVNICLYRVLRTILVPGNLHPLAPVRSTAEVVQMLLSLFLWSRDGFEGPPAVQVRELKPNLRTAGLRINWYCVRLFPSVMYSASPLLFDLLSSTSVRSIEYGVYTYSLPLTSKGLPIVIGVSMYIYTYIHTPYIQHTSIYSVYFRSIPSATEQVSHIHMHPHMGKHCMPTMMQERETLHCINGGRSSNFISAGGDRSSRLRTPELVSPSVRLAVDGLPSPRWDGVHYGRSQRQK